MSETFRSRAFDVLLLAALALALFVTNPRVTFIDDEVSIVSAAAAPLRQTLDAFRSGVGVHEHPPLYDIFLHFWLIFPAEPSLPCGFRRLFFTSSDCGCFREPSKKLAGDPARVPCYGSASYGRLDFTSGG
jgi:hypothetical protein